jgi:hypothetical protein
MSARSVVLGLAAVILAGCGTNYIQGVGVTATKDYLTGLIEDAFRAGATHDLAAGRQALDQLDHATKPDAGTVRLVHEFTTAAAECRNPKEAQ